MATTIVYKDRLSESARAESDGKSLWLTPADLLAVSGWERKPEGLCLDEVCVPIPPAQTAVLSDANGRIDLAAFGRYLGAPVVHDEPTDTWVVGESATARRDALLAVEAPDFTLPDLDGTRHSLSDYRGKKVLLLSWATW